MTQPKIGLLTLFFDMYLTSGDALLKSCTAFSLELAENLANHAVVVYPGVCINRSDVDKAVYRFETEDVDLIVVVFLTYTPSMYVLPALKKTQLPVLLFCTQKMPAVTEAITPWETDENHGVHGYQDLANVLRRAGKAYQYLAGYWKDEKTQSELISWLQAAHARKVLQSSGLGLLGYPMENMGDFGVDETAFQSQLGLHIYHLPMKAISKIAQAAPQDEIERYIQQDLTHFKVCDMVTREQHEAAVRLEWALRKTLQEKNLLGFASHFLAVGQDGWLDTLPFLAASELMAEGDSFGGEGDVTSASAVSILQMVAGEANFTEIFTIDFGGSSVLLSHMGEGNWKMARTDYPIQMRSDPFDMVPLRINPVSLVFTLRPGPATLLNITIGPDEKIQWIVSEGEVVDSAPLPKMINVHNKFKPVLPVEEFLRQYSLLGGSHHQALAYGSWSGELEKLASLMGIQYYKI